MQYFVKLAVDSELFALAIGSHTFTTKLPGLIVSKDPLSAWRIGRYRGTPLDSSLAPILYTMGTQQTWRY